MHIDWSKIARPVFGTLFSLVLFGLMGEGLLRVYLIRNVAYDVEMTRYSSLLKVASPNPLIGHEHRPNASAHLMNVDVAINSDGLRDKEYSTARTAARRIVFLGDSLTLGWGVRADETFESLIESRLNHTAPTEILNFGIGNYNTVQETNLFLEKGLKYRPDEVVVFYFINDAEPVPASSRWEFLGHSRFITFFWSRLHAVATNLLGAPDFRDYYAGLYNEDQAGWGAAKQAFLQLKGVCDARKIALRVVVLPELHELVEYPFTREHQSLENFLRANEIPVFDLLPAFEGRRDAMNLWVALDDAHPNAAAHRIIADAALRFVDEGAAATNHAHVSE